MFWISEDFINCWFKIRMETQLSHILSSFELFKLCHVHIFIYFVHNAVVSSWVTGLSIVQGWNKLLVGNQPAGYILWLICQSQEVRGSVADGSGWVSRDSGFNPPIRLQWWKLLITANSARLLCRCFARKAGPSLIEVQQNWRGYPG